MELGIDAAAASSSEPSSGAGAVNVEVSRESTPVLPSGRRERSRSRDGHV